MIDTVLVFDVDSKELVFKMMREYASSKILEDKSHYVVCVSMDENIWNTLDDYPSILLKYVPETKVVEFYDVTYNGYKATSEKFMELSA